MKKKLILILLILNSKFLFSAEIKQQKEYEEQYAILLYDLDGPLGVSHGVFYFYLKPSEPLSVLFELIENYFYIRKKNISMYKEYDLIKYNNSKDIKIGNLKPRRFGELNCLEVYYRS